MTTPSRPGLRAPIVLSGATFVVAWEQLGLGALPQALFLPSRARRWRCAPGTAAECYGWVVPAHGATFGLLAAGCGRHAVLATLDAPVVELSPIEAGELAWAVAHRLGPSPAGAAPLAMGGYTRPAFERAAGVSVTGNGQLFVAVRDRLGRRRQGERAIEYVDTTGGRWLLRRDPDSAVPGTVAAIAAELDAARHRLTVRSPRHAGVG